ncbi:hypothetical protein HK103_002261 [Boothiomyces macroporosus]|uniref:Acyltransferase 3 domain-containing protein n=1 Tax=Boothiomyces macroporosus TaxID=261099 RepID=A0AAD5UD74_9FUNG|nr:hypothetical protein HK103_002261 [Boothiomyces macroporosus]
MGKLIYLEAIRGLAALIVALHHFDLALTEKNNYLYQLKNEYPILKFLTDGNLAVTTFFILSGRVLTLSFLKRELSLQSFENLSSGVFKRSFRLVLPVLAVLFISQLLGYFHLHDSVRVANGIAGTTGWYQPPTEFQSFKEFVVFFINIFTNTFYVPNNGYFPFEIRMLITELSVQGHIKKMQPSYFWAFRVLLFVFFYISYQQCYVGGETWGYLFYKYSRDLYQTSSGSINNPGDLWYQPQDPRIFMAACMIMLVELTPTMQTILNTMIFDFLGKISFGLYLAHGVVLSAVVSKVFVALVSSGRSIEFAQTVSFFVFWAVSITCGWLIFKYIDMPSVRLSKRLRALFIRRVPAPLEQIVVPTNLPE